MHIFEASTRSFLASSSLCCLNATFNQEDSMSNQIPVTQQFTLLEKLADRLAALSGGCVAVMAVLIGLDVIARHVFHSSITGVLEIEEMLMAVLVFSSFAFIQKGEHHIRIDLFMPLLPKTVQKGLNLFSYAIGLIFYSFMTWRLFVLAYTKFLSNEHTLDLEIPIFYFIAVAAFCTLVFTLILLLQVIKYALQLVHEKNFLALILVVLGLIVLCTLPWWFRGLELGLSRSIQGVLGMCLLMVLIFMSVPIAFAMGIIGMLGMLTLNMNFGATFSSLGSSSFNYATSYVLSVIPMFCLMGELAYHSGISRDLFNSANVWLGHKPAGLAMAGVAGCAGFAAVCGDSLATAVTMSSVSLPEMRAKKYDPGLACACLAAGGTLGILIPPSIGFIFYSIITEESVGRLFMAGVIPGIMLAALFCLVLYIIAVRQPERAPRGAKTTFGEKLQSLRGILGMLGLIILIMGGILTGFFTPTEGGAVGALGALIISLLKRKLTWDNFKASLIVTLEITGKLMLILVSVNFLGIFLANTRLPQFLAEFFTSFESSRYIVLLGIVIFYLIMGCLMNVLPLVLLSLPSIFPTVEALGFDPIWFGVVIVILMEAGQITPPVGVNVYAISSCAKDVPMEQIFKNILPFFLMMLLMILILTIFPGIATWLPDMIFGPRFVD